MEIKSEKALVNASKSDIIHFLKDARNLEHLLPTDKIQDFKSDESTCSFKVQGAIVITLVENGVSENEVFLKSGEKAPFPFDLTVQLSDQGNQTEGYIHFQGDVNMFIKMMAEKPLTALFEHMTKALQQHYAL
jgi:carbon monoxide dehydrogenase subunit G